MKKIIILASALVLAGLVVGCDNAVTPDDYEPYYIAGQNEDTSYEYNQYEDSKITVNIPRELFFAYGAEEYNVAFFEEFGGIVELFEDSNTFWDNYPENAGTQYIEVSFYRSDLAALGREIESGILSTLYSIVAAFDSISEFEKETDEIATRIVFMANFDELDANGNFIALLDFTFPYIGELEYLRRIFKLYDMAYLEEIVFDFQDNETQERIEVYCFLSDAPLGLAMRHGH